MMFCSGYDLLDNVSFCVLFCCCVFFVTFQVRHRCRSFTVINPRMLLRCSLPCVSPCSSTNAVASIVKPILRHLGTSEKHSTAFDDFSAGSSSQPAQVNYGARLLVGSLQHHAGNVGSTSQWLISPVSSLSPSRSRRRVRGCVHGCVYAPPSGMVRCGLYPSFSQACI